MSVDIYSLKYGDQILTTFGAWGTQTSKVVKAAREGKHGVYVKVVKWVASQKCWTKNAIQVYETDIIEMAPYSRRIEG